LLERTNTEHEYDAAFLATVMCLGGAMLLRYITWAHGANCGNYVFFNRNPRRGLTQVPGMKP